MAVNIGLILASLLSILLQSTLSKQQMLVWGWRIPFIISSLTAIMGYFMRLGLPEPPAFIKAVEEEEKAIQADNTEAGTNAQAVAGKPAARDRSPDASLVIDDTPPASGDAEKRAANKVRVIRGSCLILTLLRLVMHDCCCFVSVTSPT